MGNEKLPSLPLGACFVFFSLVLVTIGPLNPGFMATLEGPTVAELASRAESGQLIPGTTYTAYDQIHNVITVRPHQRIYIPPRYTPPMEYYQPGRMVTIQPAHYQPEVGYYQPGTYDPVTGYQTPGRYVVITPARYQPAIQYYEPGRTVTISPGRYEPGYYIEGTELTPYLEMKFNSIPSKRFTLKSLGDGSDITGLNLYDGAFVEITFRYSGGLSIISIHRV